MAPEFKMEIVHPWPGQRPGFRLIDSNPDRKTWGSLLSRLGKSARDHSVIDK